MIIIGFLSLSTAAGAKSSWWDKGKKLLDNFSPSKNKNPPTAAEIGAGLKEALRIGTKNVVSQLGQIDGFNADAAIHIPLPEDLKKVKTVLNKIGMSSLLDNLELKLNRAAEVATPKAKKLFWEAITEMTLDDVKAIYKGPEDAATRYFQRKMTPPLAKQMRPVVQQSLSEVKAIKAYDNAMRQYQSFPFVSDVKADLTGYVIEKGMDGIFYYLAREEAAIRKNPAKRTTDLLKRVFGHR
ncbi:MAG: DUF4197 domain-containing protein [Desulfobacterales bacterium]|nr:DUF4197 domain-containing protein [Desulfobacterales bacterium]